MIRAVFDTNVLVSGFLSPNGPPGQIVEWLRSGAAQAALDDHIVSEYSEVLARSPLPTGANESRFRSGLAEFANV